MKHKLISLLVLLPGLTLMGLSAAAQDISTKGAVSGTVVDTTGAVVPGATVTITGPIGERVVVTNSGGGYEVANLIPGKYTVKASLAGFKTASVSDVTVYVGKATSVRLTLSTGDIAETIEVVGGAVDIDTGNTAVGANINSQVFQNLPIQRRVDNLFYLAPGVTESQAGGRANPSISGGSPLDNLYIADGVSITDSAFGGLGVFSRVYGTLGVGINTAFIKEVQVKTAGFAPQYGQSQGGIVNIITQSGGNEYHGAVYGFARPKAFEATRRQPDDFSVNKFGKILHEENYDVGVNVGGYVPGLRKNLFFFSSFNPTIRRQIVRGASGSGLERILGNTAQRYRTLNYAFKLEYAVNQNHSITFSIFGDPTKTNLAPIRLGNIDNTTTNSKLDFGTRNTSLRYSGTLSSTWTLSGSFSQGQNHFDESGFGNFSAITDRTQPLRGNFRAIGLGFFEPSEGTTYRLAVDTSKQICLLGTHTLGVGYQYQRALYKGTRANSGPFYTVP